MSEFNAGDVVTLKSPLKVPMTIEEIKDDTAYCTWLDKSHRQVNGVFKCATLMLYVDPLADYDGGVGINR